MRSPLLSVLAAILTLVAVARPHALASTSASPGAQRLLESTGPRTVAPWIGDSSAYTLDSPVGGDTPTVEVNVVNGNLFVQQPGPYEPIELLLHMDLQYNSLAAGWSAFGNRWTSDMAAETRLAIFGDGSVSPCGPGGYQPAYTPNGDGTYTAPLGGASTVTENGGTYTVLDNATGEVDTFNALGILTGEITELGDTDTLTYDRSGRLTTITNEHGETTRFSYGSSASRTLVTTITAPEDVTATLTYDRSGNLTSYTDYVSGTTSYSYDRSGHLTTITLPSGAPINVTYDGQGRVASVTGRVNPDTGTIPTTSYTYGMDQTRVTDPNGGVTTYMYDGATGRVTHKADPQRGYLRVTVVDSFHGLPIPGARVRITPDSAHASVTLTTDARGITPTVAFPTPPAPTSDPGRSIFWSTVTVSVSAPGHATYTQAGVQIEDYFVQELTAALVPGTGTYAVAADGTVTDHTSHPGHNICLAPC